MAEVPRRTSLAPLASPRFVLSVIGVETEGLLGYQGRAGIISIVRWNLRPVIFGAGLPGSQKVLRRPVWGFPYTSSTETLSNAFFSRFGPLGAKNWRTLATEREGFVYS